MDKVGNGFRATTLICAAAALLATTAVAHADPQSSSLCPEGALTLVPDGRLQCRAGQWQPLASASPADTQWLTYGPPMTLSGQARNNPEIAAGGWIGDPQEPKSRCRAEQVLAADPPERPRVTTGQPGRPVTVQVVPRLDTITLSGDCLWRRVS